MEGILVALGIVALLWILYRGIKGNKDAFSAENLSKSFTTLGIMALILIVLVAFAVFALRK